MRPAISFLLPYRLFKEDKEFLDANLRKQIESFVGKENLEDLLRINNYQVVLDVIYNKPVDIPVNNTFITKALKPLFKHGKCVAIDQTYTPTKSKGSLPVINFKVYF